jgi:hypothetical protein
LSQCKIEGYWRKTLSEKSDLPFPVANELSQEQAETIYQLILKKEDLAKMTTYRGFSHSRLENGKIVGCREFKFKDWIWPEGFSKHYVLENKVKPSKEFLEFIGYDAEINGDMADSA